MNNITGLNHVIGFNDSDGNITAQTDQSRIFAKQTGI